MLLDIRNACGDSDRLERCTCAECRIFDNFNTLIESYCSKLGASGEETCADSFERCRKICAYKSCTVLECVLTYGCNCIRDRDLFKRGASPECFISDRLKFRLLSKCNCFQSCCALECVYANGLYLCGNYDFSKLRIVECVVADLNETCRL